MLALTQPSESVKVPDKRFRRGRMDIYYESFEVLNSVVDQATRRQTHTNEGKCLGST